METKISSKKNKIIQYAVQLMRSDRKRKEKNDFIIEGARLCIDASKSDIQIKNFLFTESAKKKYNLYFQEIFQKATNCYEIEEHVADFLSDTKHAQGFFCICQLPRRKDFSLKIEGKYIALENIQNPVNVGAIIRTAAAFELDGILLSQNTCDLYNPKVLRAAMGAVFRMPVYEINMISFLQSATQNGYQPYAATTCAEARKVNQVDFSKGSIIVIGNEGAGLSKEAIEACSSEITIPMKNGVESLNAAVAASILIWEMLRK